MLPEVVVPKVDENRRYTTRVFMHFIKRVAGVTTWDLDAAADQESHHAERWFAAPGDVAPGAAAFDGLKQSWLPPPEAKIDRPHGYGWRPCPTCKGSCSVPVEGGGKACPTCYDHQGQVNEAWLIFVNPPFDDLATWLAKVWATIAEANAAGIDLRIAFVMPGNRTEQGHWQDHVEPFLEGHERAGRDGYKLVAHSPRTRQNYGHPGNVEGLGSGDDSSGGAKWPSVVLVWRRA